MVTKHANQKNNNRGDKLQPEIEPKQIKISEWEH